MAYIRSVTDGASLAGLDVYRHVAIPIRDGVVATIGGVFPVGPTKIAVAATCCPRIGYPTWGTTIFMEPSKFVVRGVVLENTFATAVGVVGREDFGLDSYCS